MNMTLIVQGVLHLLDRDGTALCSSPFGLLTGSLARCTCASCLDMWESTRNQLVRPLAIDDDQERGH
jgi:hypothetical protein